MDGREWEGSGGAGPVDYAILPHARRVELLSAMRRERARLDAREQRLLHAMHADPVPNIDGSPALDKQWVREDVACASRISPATAAARLHQASALVTRLPATLALLQGGEISLPHAARLIDAIAPLPDSVAAKVEARVLKRAPRQTVAQFADSVRRAVLALDERDQDQQVHDAEAERRVVFTPQENGMSELWALLPAPAATRLKDVLDQAAARTKARPGPGHDRSPDQRSADQRRADALTDLAADHAAAHGNAAGAGPRVQVTVALSTLLELDQQPGELDGYGPISAAQARALAFDPTGTWRRLLTDAAGNLVQASADTYRPPAAMARHVRAAHPTCCFPGCRRKAICCELDHITAWGHGGATHPDNLQPLCTRHHHLKHDTGWSVHRDPTGTTIWQSPSGHVYTRPPDPLPLDTTNVAVEPEPELGPEFEPVHDPPTEPTDDPPPF